MSALSGPPSWQGRRDQPPEGSNGRCVCKSSQPGATRCAVGSKRWTTPPAILRRQAGATTVVLEEEEGGSAQTCRGFSAVPSAPKLFVRAEVNFPFSHKRPFTIMHKCCCFPFFCEKVRRMAVCRLGGREEEEAWSPFAPQGHLTTLTGKRLPHASLQ